MSRNCHQKCPEKHKNTKTQYMENLSMPTFLKTAIKYLKNTQNDYKIETIQRYLVLMITVYEDEIYDNPNFHSEEQDEFELPDSKHSFV
ncbi:hypothetical protein RhiirC2_772482 [Rhizophagus irregularis]|uniref:Uncharacterized protein n=1 Tax=Rhizophagus irregularis TaxID=588596 RepID=A0A2N1NRD9_9GLOM|nr:hypothetical protein RhiirC2_772482 [Rhizophagus irregularis]